MKEKIYNHVFEIALEVKSKHENADEILIEDLLKSLFLRYLNLSEDKDREAFNLVIFE